MPLLRCVLLIGRVEVFTSLGLGIISDIFRNNGLFVNYRVLLMDTFHCMALTSTLLARFIEG